MDKDAIISLLKQINYPGYNRDIVSFGIVNEINFSDNTISIKLNLQKDNKDIDNIKNLIKDLLTKTYPHIKIILDIHSPATQNNSAGEIKALNKVKHIVAIASGKGGVGKSTTTVNLASSLSKDFKIGILDLDIYGPSLQMALGCDQKPLMNSNNMLLPIDSYGMKTMSFGFLNDESAPTIWRGPMVSRMTEQFFSQVDWGELDILFLDLPPGTGDIQLTLVQKIALSGAIIVTTPQDLALLDVKKASDMFGKLNTPIMGVVENMSNFIIDGKIYDDKNNLVNGILTVGNKEYSITNGKFEVELDIFKGKGGLDESNRLNVPLLSRIPLNSELAQATDLGTPYVLKHKNTHINECYKNIGKQIIKQLGL